MIERSWRAGRQKGSVQFRRQRRLAAHRSRATAHSTAVGRAHLGFIPAARSTRNGPARDISHGLARNAGMMYR